LPTIKGMREGMKPVMWVVAVVFVASLFFVGVTTLRKTLRGEGRGPAVVEIDGDKIGQEDFERIFYREMGLRYRHFQRESNRAPTQEEERGLRVTTVNAVVNQIVLKELTLREARRMGLRITDEDVRILIEKMPIFQTDGEFDQRKYENTTVEEAGMAPGEFEAWLRDEILMNRVFAMVGSAARVSEAEVKARFDEEGEKVRVAYAFLPASLEPTVKPSEEALKTYYSAHLAKYHSGRRVSIRYVLVDLAKQRKEVKASEAEVKEYYERNKHVYADAGQIRCRHILFAVPPGEEERAWEEARAKAEKAAARARAGEDFAKLAQELSEDPGSAREGGDLGFFPKGRTDQGFEAAAFALKEGEISGPVKSIYGYHVIKREPDFAPFEEQADEIKEMLETQAAENRALTLATDLAQRVGAGGELAAEAAALDLKVEKAGPFEAAGTVGDLGWQQRIAEEAFTLDAGGTGSVLPVVDSDPRAPARRRLRGYVVYQVAARLEPGPAPFDEVKETVARDWRRDEALAAVSAAAGDLYRRAKEAGDVAAAAEAAGADYGETAAFNRLAPAPELGADYGVAAAAFDAQTGQVIGPLRAPSGYYVVKVLEKAPADPTLYATRADEYKARLLDERRRRMLEEWYRDLVARARIKNDLSAYLGAEQEEAPGEREGGFDMPLGPLGY
jgi:peptidyl-prolyl cis-trans isomerase D